MAATKNPELPQAESVTPHEDGILELMRVFHTPLTREAYVEVAGLSEPLGEMEWHIPEEFRLVTPDRGSPSKKPRRAKKK